MVDPAYAWTTEPLAPCRYADTVTYEVHVTGFTAAHPEVPPELRGTDAGSATTWRSLTCSISV